MCYDKYVISFKMIIEKKISEFDNKQSFCVYDEFKFGYWLMLSKIQIIKSDN